MVVKKIRNKQQLTAISPLIDWHKLLGQTITKALC